MILIWVHIDWIQVNIILSGENAADQFHIQHFHLHLLAVKVFGSIFCFSIKSNNEKQNMDAYFLYFATKLYVVGTQKNCLNKTVLLSTQNISIKLISEKIVTILLNWSYEFIGQTKTRN